MLVPATATSRRWQPVTKRVLDELAARSQQRTAASSEFAVIREKIEEARRNDGVVRLADLIKRQNEAKANESNGDAATDDADDEEAHANSPQLNEAIDVLADLVTELNS